MARRRVRQIALAAALGAAAYTDARPSLAEPEPEPIRIVFSAPEGCPDHGAFLRELRMRPTLPWKSAEQGYKRTFHVMVTLAHGVFHGRLSVDDGEATYFGDKIAGRRCAEVVSALALKTATAIDTPPPPRPPPPPPPPPQPRPDLPWRVKVGATLSMLDALSSDIALAESFFLDAARAGEGLGATSVRISLMRASGESLIGEFPIHMGWIAAQFEGCPARLRRGRLSLLPCLAVDAGVIEWQATRQQPRARSWVAFEVLVRAELDLFSFLSLEAQAGAIAPATRDKFGFDAVCQSCIQAPLVGGMVGIGLGVRFP